VGAKTSIVCVLGGGGNCGDEVVRPVPADRNTVTALEERGLIFEAGRRVPQDFVATKEQIRHS
jgi:hypothetical protein